MVVANRISEQEYCALALGDPKGRWELWDGVPVEKPPMSWKRNRVSIQLAHRLQLQLDQLHPGDFSVGTNGGRSRISARNSYIPDVIVIPAAYEVRYRERPADFETYADPLPFVAEVWSPSTGTYDVETKLRGYQERGDHVIWFVHPFERTVTARVRQPDGSYVEQLYQGGVVSIASLPNVSIDLDALFVV